jgi:hypothetical protein
LTIDRIVVPERGRVYTPNGISLYARWLLLAATFGESLQGELRRMHLPRTRLNIGCVGEVSLVLNYVHRVMGGTTTALSAPYKLPSKITELFIKGEQRR